MHELLDESRWPHIYVYEIACRCDNELCPYKTREQIINVIDPRVLDFYERLRAHLGGRPLSINSAIRCSPHNHAVGGVRYSPHMVWKLGTKDGKKQAYAIDVSIIGHFSSPRQMRDEARTLDPDVRIGWKKYNTFCHFDFAFNHPYMVHEEMRRNWVRGGEW
ncbi:MAG: hypothetical protein JW885_02765 [Deltaproteobacteria bacterium]|nr:hypothetical protein [Candidatus Zymogenaceae bacterium]